MEITLSNFTIISVNNIHYDFIRNLRNDPQVKLGFINQSEISHEDHLKYMEINNPCYRICLLNDEPIGYVGVIDNDIRVAVSPSHARIGAAKFMILSILKEFPGASAKIKINNSASLELFKSCGFELAYYVYKPVGEESFKNLSEPSV
jgi:hypothetical protein